MRGNQQNQMGMDQLQRMIALQRNQQTAMRETGASLQARNQDGTASARMPAKKSSRKLAPPGQLPTKIPRKMGQVMPKNKDGMAGMAQQGNSRLLGMLGGMFQQGLMKKKQARGMK